MGVLEEGTKGFFPSTCPQEAPEANSALMHVQPHIPQCSKIESQVQVKSAQTEEREKLFFLVVRNLVPFEHILAI